MKIHGISPKPSFKAKFSPEVKELLQNDGGEILNKYGENSKEFGSFKRIVNVMKKYCPEATIQIVEKHYEDKHYITDAFGKDFLACVKIIKPRYDLVLKDPYSREYRWFLDCAFDKRRLFVSENSYPLIRATMRRAHAENYGTVEKRTKIEEKIKPVIDKLLN